MGNNDVSVDTGTCPLIGGSFYIRRLVSLSISVPNCARTHTAMRKRREHLQREGRESTLLFVKLKTFCVFFIIFNHLHASTRTRAL